MNKNLLICAGLIIGIYLLIGHAVGEQNIIETLKGRSISQELNLESDFSKFEDDFLKQLDFSADMDDFDKHLELTNCPNTIRVCMHGQEEPHLSGGYECQDFIYCQKHPHERIGHLLP